MPENFLSDIFVRTAKAILQLRSLDALRMNNKVSLSMSIDNYRMPSTKFSTVTVTSTGNVVIPYPALIPPKGVMRIISDASVVIPDTNQVLPLAVMVLKATGGMQCRSVLSLTVFAYVQRFTNFPCREDGKLFIIEGDTLNVYCYLASQPFDVTLNIEYYDVNL